MRTEIEIKDIINTCRRRFLNDNHECSRCLIYYSCNSPDQVVTVLKWVLDGSGFPPITSDTLRTDLAAANERAEELEELVQAFQASAMLTMQGDPEGITPKHIEDEITTLRTRIEAAVARFDEVFGLFSKPMSHEHWCKARKYSIDGYGTCGCERKKFETIREILAPDAEPSGEEGK